MLFALISATEMVSAKDLYRLCKPLEINAQHLTQAYMEDEPIGVVPVDRESNLPAGCVPVVFVDESEGSSNLAEHWWDALRSIPAARVLVRNTSGLLLGRNSACEAASHEILEARMNARLRTWKPHPTRLGVEVAFEVCDPTQDHYYVHAHGEDWPVSNFITPHWFMQRFVDRPDLVRELERDFGYGLDWCKRMTQPGELSAEGYYVLRQKQANGTYKRWSEDGRGTLTAESLKLAGKQHRSSRTNKLGGVR